MTWHRILATSWLAMGILAGCSSPTDGEPGARPSIALSTLDFEIASGALVRLSDGGEPAWGAIATSAPDSCRLLDEPSLPPGVSFVQIQVLGDASEDCPIASGPSENAGACQALVRIGRSLAEDRIYRLAAESGHVRAVFQADGSATWHVEAAFRKHALSAAACDGGIGAGGEEEGLWTCVSAAGENSECAGSCWVPAEESCCSAGPAETEPLVVDFVTPGCGDSPGTGGTGGSGDTSCENVCRRIRECADPEARDRCVADCESAMEESCRTCYATVECGESCATGCPADRCWSQFECDLESEYCDLEATEPRCRAISGGGGGGAGGGGD